MGAKFPPACGSQHELSRTCKMGSGWLSASTPSNAWNVSLASCLLLRTFMRPLILGVILALALPSAALAKPRHGKRTHAAKKVRGTKRGRLARKQDLTPVSSVAANPEPFKEPPPTALKTEPPAAAPAAATGSSSLEPVLGHKTTAVTPHEASNQATQATDDEMPG